MTNDNLKTSIEQVQIEKEKQNLLKEKIEYLDF